jgi:LAGLIDADG endonuclease
MEDHYIAGFVDGEGSFHIAFQRNPDVRIGWQAVPEFHVSQDVSSRHVLEAIRDRLDCGIIKANHRGSRNDRTHVLVVRNRQDLTMKVIPFFDRYPLHTVKKNDFESFKRIVVMMNSELHRSADGFKEIVSIAYSMNANGSRRRINREAILGTLKSSETIRQRSLGPMQPEVIKI